MKEGLIPTIVGAGVVASGVCMKKMYMKKAMMYNMLTVVEAGMVGFGLAHVLLGTIDLICDKKE